tara:strand:+ start:7345 stop:7554 length:210 start_codon:yes stop_codon:yes gene_type:complete
MGQRVFTMDDWIVRVEPHEGKVRLVGVPPDIPEEAAMERGVQHTLLRPSEIKSVSIDRRKAYMNGRMAT